MNEDTQPAGMQLNIPEILADKQLPAVIRSLMIQIRDVGFVNVGKFFQDMSDVDLAAVAQMAEAFALEAAMEEDENEFSRATQHLSLMGLALMVGDGEPLVANSLEISLKLTMTYIALEGLSRLGLVRALHDNWSMDLHSTKPIAAAIDKPE